MSGLLGGRCTPCKGRSRAVLTDEGFLSSSLLLCATPARAAGPPVGKTEVFYVFLLRSHPGAPRSGILPTVPPRERSARRCSFTLVLVAGAGRSHPFPSRTRP